METDSPTPSSPLMDNHMHRFNAKTGAPLKKPIKKHIYCPYTHVACPGIFSCKHNLNQHIREKHTGEKPNRCPICVVKAFPRPWSLTRHLSKVHGVTPKHRSSRRTTPSSRRANTPCSPSSIDADTPWTDGEFPTTPSSSSSSSSPSPSSSCSPCSLDTEEPITPQGQQQRRQNREETRWYAPTYLHATAPMVPHGWNSSTLEMGATACFVCEAEFEVLEDVLVHFHHVHGEPPSVFCSCGVCKGRGVI